MGSGRGRSAKQSAVTPPRMSDRLEQSGFNRALINVDASLPVEWHFDGLVRISPDTPETVGRWRAWASGPNG